MITGKNHLLWFGTFAVMVLLLGITTEIQIVDPRLKPYVNEYMVEVHKICGDDYFRPPFSSIGIADHLDSPEDIGVTISYPARYRILIDARFWKEHANDVYGKTVVDHELTHALFHMGHTDDPNDYMYPYAPTGLTDEILKMEVDKTLESICVK